VFEIPKQNIMSILLILSDKAFGLTGFTGFSGLLKTKTQNTFGHDYPREISNSTALHGARFSGLLFLLKYQNKKSC